MAAQKKHKKVLVAMSGGVDSSVAALLLKKEGYDLAGATMCLGIAEDGAGEAKCCGADAVGDARRVCDAIGIPHYVLDFAAAMEEKVIGRFIAEYRRGRTPNPCVDCNACLKFGLLLDRSRAMGFDYLATGHYALLESDSRGIHMRKPADRGKDQTYFLYPIGRTALDAVLFPLGGLMKEEVRRIAAEAGLPVAGKAESQDICFVGRGNLSTFFERHGCDIHPGEIVNRSGRVLGRHRGIVYYTIGQRGGLGISHPTPLYVLEIDAAANRIVVGNKDELRSRGLTASALICLQDGWPLRAAAKIRYRKKEVPCRLEAKGDKLLVLFDEQQEAVTPGQSVVLYDGDTVVGGGIIEGAIGEH